MPSAKPEISRIIAAGLRATLNPEEQALVDQCVKNLKSVISVVDPRLALIAYMNFSCDLTDQVGK